MARRFSRESFGVRNRSPWRRMFADAVHQFHENDLFSSAAAMSYFGLMTLFPALLLLLALSNRIAAGTQMIQHIVEVYQVRANSCAPRLVLFQASVLA